jgi:hypothetical protein
VISFIVFISAWRCYYFPPTPRDLTSGPEVIAEYTVKEKNMINSVFTVNLETTNNQFKPPFITSLQIIYKYAGFPFGQIWLSAVFISFLIFLYHALLLRIHSLVAGLLIIFFVAIPEMYAYSFMVLFDYSNAVFFFLSIYFLFDYLKTREKNKIVLAGILMAIATYIRSETLIFAGLVMFFLLWDGMKKKIRLPNLFMSCALFLLPSGLLYLLSIKIYIDFYLPAFYNIESQLNPHLFDFNLLFKRFKDMNSKLLFSHYGIQLYAYFIFIFLLIFILDKIWSRSNKQSKNWLYALLLVYFGYPLIGHLLPLLDIDNSTKRGLFKIFPFMLLYMASSSVLIKLSNRIKKWEGKMPAPQFNGE